MNLSLALLTEPARVFTKVLTPRVLTRKQTNYALASTLTFQ